MDENSLFYIAPFLGPIILLIALAILFTMMNRLIKPIAESYPIRSQFTGKWLNFQTMQMSALAIKGCVSLGFDKNFFYIKIHFFPMNLGAQIPWSSVRSIRKERRFLCNYYVLTIGDESKIKFYGSKAFEKAINENIEAAKLLAQSDLGDFG